jgi:transmembrane sensor
MDQTTRFEYLIDRLHKGSASEPELRELLSLITQPDSKPSDDLDNILKKIWQDLPADSRPLSEHQSNLILNQLLHTAKENKTSNTIIRKINFRKIAAAAAILVCIGTAGWFYISKNAAKETRAIVTAKYDQPQILPGSNKAELILEDGSSVSLDSAGNGNIASQGNMNVKSVNGHIVYTPATTNQAPKAIAYNILRIPKGGFYQLTLSDGTKLWLNAASSLRYPVTFSETERIVELNGEGYFEVAKDTKRPFKVLVKGVNIEVLGTHFNVMAYDNETAIKTTLLEGSVKVRATGKDAILSPGQQAKHSENGTMEILNGVNLEEVVAWKNGYFHFERAGLEVLMRQIERWYDVEVIYDGPVQQRAFGGKISRNSNIKDVLKILALSRISFRIENKTIIVNSKI